MSMLTFNLMSASNLRPNLQRCALRAIPTLQRRAYFQPSAAARFGAFISNAPQRRTFGALIFNPLLFISSLRLRRAYFQPKNTIIIFLAVAGDSTGIAFCAP